MMKVRYGAALPAAAMALLVYAAVPAHAQFTTTNLLTNPGAETGDLTAWTTGGTSNPHVDDGSFNGGINPHTGSFDFVGGNGASGTLTQTIALVGTQGITAAQIDAGLATANLSFWEQGLNQGTPSDDTSVSLFFRDSVGGLITSVDSGEVDSHNGTWANYSNSFLLPTGTRTLDYTMNFIRHAGSDLDGYVDDNSLTVTVATPNAAAPEPNSVALLTLGLLPCAGLIARRKRGNPA